MFYFHAYGQYPKKDILNILLFFLKNKYLKFQKMCFSMDFLDTKLFSCILDFTMYL
jgi:hypothetical protein